MLDIKNVNYKYNSESENSDISEINLEVKKGECVLLCGRSGSGKTTITKLINSLIPNYYETGDLSGEVFIGGMETSNSQIYEVSRVVSSVFQNPKTQFFNVNTTSEILFYLENRGFDREYMKDKLQETADLFGIRYLFDRDIFALSGGEKQIIAIAAAYASGTDIILLDEPSSNLDEEKTKIIGKILIKLKELGKTIIISEHRFYHIKEIIDRIYYIDGGKIVSEFTKKEFFNIDENKRKAMGLRSIEFEELTILGGVDNSNKEIKENGNSSLVIEHLLYKFREQHRKIEINNQNFDFGTVIGVYGKNGIGKSTFIRLIMGLEKYKNIAIKLNDKPLARRKRLKMSYMVMQDVNHQLFTDSVYTEVSLGKDEKYSPEYTDKVLEKLRILDLKDKHPMSLSGGQKQRVAIASAILSGAKIICFDEPTSGMDYENMMRISKLIKDTVNEENIVFVISHDNEFLNRTADEIFDMSKYNFTM